MGICIVLLFCGEESHYYAYGFLEENPFFLVDSKNKEMYSEGFSSQLMDLAQKYNVGLYAEKECPGNDGIIEQHVYFNSILADELKSKKQYREGKWNSILSDPVRVVIHDFSSFADGGHEMPDCVYIVGDIEKARRIRTEIVEDFNASEVRMGEFPVETDIIVFLWLVVGAVFLFLTLIEVVITRKEEDYDAAYLVLIPEGAGWDEESLENDDALESACGNESRVICRYTGDYEIVCTTGGEGRLTLTVCKNPIVLLRNHKDTGESVARVMADFSVSAMKVMVQMKSEQNIVDLRAHSDEAYSVTIGKVIDLMNEQKQRQDTLVMSESILCGLILLYNVLLSLQLTKVDYLVNRRKNAVGYILGLTVTERYRKTIVRYTVTMIIGLVGTVGLCLKYRFALVGMLILIGVALYVIDVVFYLLRMRHMEKKGVKGSIVGGIYA